MTTDAEPTAPAGVPADLYAAALDAFRNAYAPYSGFHVGVALRAEDGRIVPGANVENASYGLSRCAEQSAVQALATAGLRRFDEAVVVTDASTPASPCGACRQILMEFAPAARLFLVNLEGAVRETTVESLLPMAFRLRSDTAD